MSASILNVETARYHVKDDFLHSEFVYEKEIVHQTGEKYVVKSEKKKYHMKTDLKVPRTGLMLVGWGGNNGSTLTASLIANRQKLNWRTKRGLQSANYFGSLMLASTTKIGLDEQGEEVYMPLRKMLPMLEPENLEISGWDISAANLGEAMQRACVLEPDLQRQVYDEMSQLKPLPSIYYSDFIALNQADRANNIMKSGGNKLKEIEIIRKDIQAFKASKKLDKVIVLWTANTERFAEITPGLNDTADNLLRAVKENESEISPSTMFAIASILEKSPFINGSPQNTFVPGVIDLAMRNDVYIGGDDFKSGQTKLKSVLVDFLVGAGIKPLAITSYNHLGNNDGLNLNSAKQFRSKEISKTNVVDDMVNSNKILYTKEGEHPDHVVVIKYVPNVGDSKRALDEYENEIFMGGRKTISIHNTCEDSLLASPLILDLCILTELMTRIQVRAENKTEYENFHPICSILSYMLKAPLSIGRPVNSLFKQKNAIENFLRACIGLSPLSDLLFHKMLR